jgi:NAD(P)-dependent dehydrogenase (short-subunit alcohol dehydrogenase family)
VIGQNGHIEYCSTKAALIGAVKAMALELAREKIRVNCVAPGLVSTELVASAMKQLTEEQLQKIIDYHPMGIGEVRDVSNAICFLLSECSKWITGTTLMVDGGYTTH